MAVRKLYTVNVATFRMKKLSDIFYGFTVARSSDEVARIVRMHVAPNKTFEIFQVCDGTANHVVAPLTVEAFMRHEMAWLDPRPPDKRDKKPLPELVQDLMTSGNAL